MSTEQPTCVCGHECPRALAAETARDRAQRGAIADHNKAVAAFEEWSERLAAAEAERDAWEVHEGELEQLVERQDAARAAAEAERDQAQAHAVDAMLAHGLAVESLRHVEAECKRDMAACEGHRRSLAVLEAAVRRIIARGTPVVAVADWEALEDALPALATPPGAGA